ncbi:hypothetical protein [Streptomyces sp. CB03911]|uniref:recombination directionality factor n=1 Tax=Streptomycetaceae TaxID=2062 RepID=UPI00093F5AFE|nr:hypothetical protein [Streptomyces sp. CB03911]OKI24402.1 hypothetical protein A6A07_05950 [Streptomyces sp. CB03911]
MSTLAIFDTDPDARPKAKFTSDIVGKFRSGMLNSLNRPVSLPNWRVTTGDPDVADTVASALGGESETWDTSGEDIYQVLTESPSVDIIVDNGDAIDSRLILWGRSGPIHECNGAVFLGPEEDQGQPCGCPPMLADRKAWAKSGRGPAPSISLTFRLASDPLLGKFKFTSSSWELAKVAHEYAEALDKVGGPAVVRLTLELVEFQTSAGQDVAFRKPVLKVLKPYDGDAERSDLSRVGF